MADVSMWVYMRGLSIQDRGLCNGEAGTMVRRVCDTERGDGTMGEWIQLVCVED